MSGEEERRLLPTEEIVQLESRGRGDGREEKGGREKGGKVRKEKEWKEKVKEQQKLGLDEKDMANLKVESVKYELLELLKSDDVPGPFTHSIEVVTYSY